MPSGESCFSTHSSGVILPTNDAATIVQQAQQSYEPPTMRPTLSIFLLAATAAGATASIAKPILRRPFHADAQQQAAMTSDDTASPSSTSQILSDILPLARGINIFAGFTRDIDGISSRLDTRDLNTTVLAPTNAAVQSLPRKPWEDPGEYAALGKGAYEGKSGEDRAHRNLRLFVEAHVVPRSPWKKGERVRTLGGNEVWWEEDGEGNRKVMPGHVPVEVVSKTAANGEVWVLKGTLNYA